MSSSVFIETTSATQRSAGDSIPCKTDSDLVVVYGKKGISFDQKGLENLIEEKKISSISVIRLTSPTPSMEEQEIEAEKNEELWKKDELGSSAASDITQSDIGTDSELDGPDKNFDTESSGVDDLNSSDEDNKSTAGKQRGRRSNRRKSTAVKVKEGRLKRKKRKDRPEIVGLNVEEFYTGREAHELLKTALKLAGVPTVKKTAEHEFMLYIIQNDHNYTPFTSPQQMKEKLAADKLEAEKAAMNSRKLVVQTSVVKNPVIKKKDDRVFQKVVAKRATKGLSQNLNLELQIEDDAELNTTDDEIGDGDEDLSDFSGFDESATSDNDRDSDLDFKLTNRKKQKGKVFRKLKRNPLISKIISNKRIPINKVEYTEDEAHSAVQTPPKSSQNNSFSKNAVVSSTPMSAPVTSLMKPLPTPDIKASKVISIKPSVSNQSKQAVPQQNSPSIQITRKANIEQSPQCVKEILINKVITSPKGVFTNISALLSDNTAEQITTFPTTPKSSQRPPTIQTPSKGFTPLGLEAAEKNQLPSQISIQTHQSKFEIAAENDKQLDLIDAIVQDEMQKAAACVSKEPDIASQNIPELVKMLESTETALQPKDTSIENRISNTTERVKSPVNIPNTLPLDSSNDVLPEDLLQHVVDLIEEDRTLKEAVEKQVFGNDSIIESLACSSGTKTTPPPLTSIYEQEGIRKSAQADASDTTKSIIQMSISNVTNQSVSLTEPLTSIAGHSDSTAVRQFSDVASTVAGSVSTSKITPVTRTEPIKIVRGNGRVITLPPIEAPTTRAKRRAQAHPPSSQLTLNNSNITETSFDSSVCSNTSFSITNDTSLSGPEKLVEKKTPDTSTKRRSSKETGAANKSQRKSNSGRRGSKSQANKSRNETEASESQDDDDPNKLWCICRQPHNNRFMICCDICEDWFHGTCVNITKAMGIEMEHKGVDWTCPKCVKKQEEKKQPRITEMLISNKKTEESLNNSIDQQLSKNVEEKNVTPTKAETLPTKSRVIEIKNIQTGQFISLQDLSQAKKSPIRVIQKKLVQSTSTPANTASVNAIKRTQHPESKQGSNTSSNKTLQKSHHNPPLKVQKAVSLTSVLSKNVEDSFENCIVCRKSARGNGIYCSDECLSKYVRNVLHHTQNSGKSSDATNFSISSAEERKKKAKSLFEDLLSMADIKPKVERITVIDRKTSRIITGSNAPTTANLKKWLQENPSFEVVLSGFTQQIEPEKLKQKPQHSTPTILNKEFNVSASTTPITTKETQPTANMKLDHPETPSPSQRNAKQLVLNTLLPSTSKQHKHVKTETKSKDEPAGSNKEKSTKRENSDGSVNKKQNENTSDHEPIRLTVRRTLKEQLLARIKDYKKDATTSSPASHEIEHLNEINRFAEEVEEFAYQTEIKMYQLFNHDTGAKYRAKYRSLMFNIKDRKNCSLFTKICAKLINPEQLVRMSPDELASQELAQWRENEAKHQLEIIKKSELDLLACTKNYVLKTHKGEEVIEDKSADNVNLDFTIPVEDVFTMLNSTADSNNENSQESSISLRKDYGSFTEYDLHAVSHSESPSITNEDEQKSKNRTKDHERDRDRDRDRDRYQELDHQKTSSEKKHRSKEHYKGGKSRSHKRSRTRSRSGSRSREKRHKSSSQRDHASGDREKSKVESERKEKKTSISSSTSSKDATIAHSSSTKEKQHTAKKINKPKSVEVFNLVDQILESSKTVEEAANLVADKEVVPTKSVETSTKSTTISNLTSSESDQELKSTVLIESPPQDPYMRYYATNSPLTNADHLFIWSGIIHMIDVTTFQTTLQYLSRSTSNFASCLPKSLEVVGRICPEIVWDYVSKIKKSPNKDIVVIRLLPSNESETAAYIELYQYLHSRNRLGVIKPDSQQIRDFYIYPLGVGKRMPPVLQNSQDDDFFNDPYRPDILIGIIIRVLGKRPAPSANLPLPSKSTGSKHYSKATNASSNTPPPGSPKRKKIMQPILPKDSDIDIDAIIKAPIATKTKQVTNPTTTNVSDEDAPYSPGGSSDSDNQVTGMRRTAEASKADQELKRKMEELNRQIAVQELEIAGLLKVDQSTTPPSTANVLANISIPPDLSQILASIRSNPSVNTTSSGQLKASSADEEYDPEESYASHNAANQRPTTSSRLAQLTEAELLRMVPDDIILDTKPARRCSDEPPPPGV